MQENGIKDKDILVPMVSEKMNGDKRLIELINATEFISKYPHLWKRQATL